jgi:DNA polymerase-1
MIIGECPGADEERLGRPFVGVSGLELDKMLHEAGLLRSECFVTNVIRLRPLGNDLDHFISRAKKAPAPDWTNIDGVWFHPKVASHIALLHKEIQLCQPTVIVPLGNLALWATTSKWGITDWRGSQLKCSTLATATVIPTYHPAAVLRQWSWRPYVISDLKRVALLLTKGVVEEPQYRFIIGPQYDQANDVLRALLDMLSRGPMHIACDIETRLGHIACIGLGWSRLDAVCIPLMCSGRPEGYWQEQEEFAILRLLEKILTHPNCHVSGQNFIYDAQYILRWLRFVPRLALDTMVTHHVCFPGMDKGLDVLASLYCDYYSFWKHEGKEWSAKQDEKVLWYYNCKDCVYTWEIAESLPAVVDKLGLHSPAVNQHRSWWNAFDTMNKGVRIDVQRKQALSTELLLETTEREQWLESVLGHPINVRSPKQLKELFYGDFGFPPVLDRKSRQPTTNDEALQKIGKREPLVRPIIRRIREIRSLGVFRSTFVEGRLDIDGRMRCSYNVAGTETFRLSSSENAFGSGMNLQNVPKGGEADDEEDPLILPNVRSLFLPDEGYEIFDMDLASADLRVVVWEADEPEMKAMLREGLDPYTEIAKEFYHDPHISKRDPRRQKFKSFAHGTNYLGTARGLAVRLGLSVHEAERTQHWYFGKFPRIELWQRNLKKNLESKRFVSNAFGYRRFFFDRIDGTVYNQAAAWIPQSTVGLLINTIWERIRREEPAVDILLQVHDSLTGQYPVSRRVYFRTRLDELSRITIPYADPLVIPTGFKTSTKSWGECG